MKHEEVGFSEQLHRMTAAQRSWRFSSATNAKGNMRETEVKLYTDAPSPDPRSGPAVCSAPTEPGLN